MSDHEVDPVLASLREQITANDRRLLEALNRRLELVAEIKREKEVRGLEFVDREREERILRDLERANDGPLSPEGLRELYQAIFELTKREVS